MKALVPERDHRLAAAVAPILCRAVARDQLELVEHIRVGAEAGGVGTALAGIVDVDPVERIIPRAVARAVHHDAAAGG
jgi:hypothetical protein